MQTVFTVLPIYHDFDVRLHVFSFVPALHLGLAASRCRVRLRCSSRNTNNLAAPTAWHDLEMVVFVPARLSCHSGLAAPRCCSRVQHASRHTLLIAATSITKNEKGRLVLQEVARRYLDSGRVNFLQGPIRADKHPRPSLTHSRPTLATLADVLLPRGHAMEGNKNTNIVMDVPECHLQDAKQVLVG
ncbi:hypothetical protein E2C01_037101 [Portunus trituberculatus]|uniref:Uncharacterized protein n=1 Tax=Portunus trituberculatus TaxID=210409 RepID=A0A5B7FG67_PORTR|nr:hypothetical protein [Portunus trituberculatus]